MTEIIEVGEVIEVIEIADVIEVLDLDGGIQGLPGTAATVEIGTVTTGTPSSVINVGTPTAAVLDIVLEKGDQGDQGYAPKIQYSADGVTWTSTVPVGVEYMRLSTDNGLTWSDALATKGTDGLDGDPGTDGTDGNTFFGGTVDPTTEGVAGDWYINRTTWHIWENVSETWMDRGSIKGADGTGTGDVNGPSSSTDEDIVLFNGLTGKLIKGSSKKVADFASVNHNLVDTTKHPVTGLTAGHVLKATGATGYAFGELAIADDSTPELGGDLDLKTYKLTKTGAGAYEFSTDEKQVDFNSNTASFTLINNTTGTTIDWRKSNKQTVAPTTNPTYTFTAPQGACNLVLKLTQPASACTITFPASVKWCGAIPDFNVNNGVFFICFFFDGTDYNGTAVKRV